MKFQKQKRTMNYGSNSVTCKNKPCRRGGSDVQFPGKLHDLMQYVESENLCHVISWVCNGRAIMIHNPDKLVKLLPLFFSQTKFRSFQRQLNMWHFERLLKGPNKGAFVHPLFLRNQKVLCKHMSRHLCDNPWKESLTMDYLLHEMDAASVIKAALNKTACNKVNNSRGMKLHPESTLATAIPSRMACSHQNNIFLQGETNLIISTIDEAEAVLSRSKIGPNDNFTLFGDDEATLLDEICDLEYDDLSSFDRRQIFALDEPFEEAVEAEIDNFNTMPEEDLFQIMPTGSMVQLAAEETSPNVLGNMYAELVQRRTQLVDLVRSSA